MKPGETVLVTGKDVFLWHSCLYYTATFRSDVSHIRFWEQF